MAGSQLGGPLLGGIADDLTGGVELAGVLTAAGARTLLVTHPASLPDDLSGVHAVVVALRSRVAPAEEALAATGQAEAALRALGVRQVFLKYCATFDSTDRGNIGNCAELLARRGAASSVLFTPSFPEAQRTVYQGHMFVGDRLLENSPKRFDPLTPMTRSDLVQILAPQTTLKVGLLPWSVIQLGHEAIRAYAATRAEAGVPFLIADTLTEADLQTIARASWDWPVATGGSTVASYYPSVWREQGLIPDDSPSPAVGVRGPGAVLAGSCSDRTREQIAAFGRSYPVLHLDPLAPQDDAVRAALDWARSRLATAPVCIATGADEASVAATQARFGAIEAGRRTEALLGRIAAGLVEQLGVRRLLVAGGETSGAVVQALGIDVLHVAPYLALGVGRCLAEAPVRLALCLKSGKLGDVEMFARVLAEMEETP